MAAAGGAGTVGAGTGTTVGDQGVTDPIVPEGDGGGAAAEAAAGGAEWVFSIVPKSVGEAGLRVVAGVSALRRITGGAYVGRVAVLNVGMT